MTANRTFFLVDNLRVMRGLDSESVDLIATDPPFNSKRSFNAPLGSRAAKQRFEDRWRWDEVTDEWHDLIAADHPAVKEVIEAAIVIEGGNVAGVSGMETGVDNSIAAFIAWMAPRVVEMHRVLKPTGSLYLHCDPSANAYLRLLLDAVFGRTNFQNEISWKRQSSHNRAKRWGPVHDTILFYAKNDGKKAWNRVLQPLDADYVERFYRHSDKHGRHCRDNLTGPGLRDGDTGKPWRDIDPSAKNRHWELPPDRALPDWFVFPDGYADMTARERLDVLDAQGLLHWPARGTMPRFKRYLTNQSGAPAGDMVTDIPALAAQSKERTGWATQKPLALYERIVEASSNEGDMVLDPFAGCATTCVAAERLNRQWIGIDIDPVAEGVTADRLKKETGLFRFVDGNPVTVRKSPPKRTDVPNVSDAKLRLTLWNNQGRRCANPYCDSGGLREVDVHLDHRIPKSRGGEDGVTNRIGLCQNCNGRKSAKAWGTFLDEERAKTPHPKIGG